jgi:hypothetical protein
MDRQIAHGPLDLMGSGRSHQETSVCGASCRETLLSIGTMGHVDVAISIVLAETGNVKSAMTGRLDGRLEVYSRSRVNFCFDGALN